MNIRFFVLLVIIGFATISRADTTVDLRHIEVSMRMIGDQVLLLAGDSTSRVLPIQRQGNRYKIEFDCSFQLTPQDLSKTVDNILLKNDISARYLVEVVNNKSDLIVYNYEVGSFIDSTLRPCGARQYDVDHYTIFITLLDADFLIAKANKIDYSTPQNSDSPSKLLVIIPILLSVGLFSYFRKKTATQPLTNSQIVIGKYLFDKQNLSLSFEQETITLTQKEAALLDLLHTRLNTVIERDEILHIVWGDEGDYVGRTLDVFISKLRKKLAQDPQLKIANVRGVGYKLMIEA